MSETVEHTFAGAADKTVRIPANLMALIRESYDSREKVLDWCLALGVVGAMAYVFRDQIRAFVIPDATPNAGLPDPPSPNMDLAGAFPSCGRRPDLYTYNMPSSRAQPNFPGPSGTAPPLNPANPPSYDGGRYDD